MSLSRSRRQCRRESGRAVSGVGGPYNGAVLRLRAGRPAGGVARLGAVIRDAESLPAASLLNPTLLLESDSVRVNDCN